VVSVLRQACRSLAEAHEAGLLHRDIKPHNLFLCRLGVDLDVVKVLDCGLVKSVGEDDAHLTADGAPTGTPAYMPPERVTGGPGGETSDLYSLGCVVFWMLTGKPVFSGDPMAMLVHHVRTPPRAPLGRARGTGPRGRRARRPRLPRQGALATAVLGARARPAARRDRACGAVDAGRGPAVVARAPAAALGPRSGRRSERRPAVPAEHRLNPRLFDSVFRFSLNIAGGPAMSLAEMATPSEA
jgi:serine/threonine protein kinase